jgi:Peptidase family M1 domain
MKHYPLFALLLLCIKMSFAQNEFQSKSNAMYWKNKSPHAAYFQQDVYYKIKANISEKSNIAQATEELIYTNNSPDDLMFVYFHLYQNAFTKGSYLEALNAANHQPIKRMGKYEALGLGTVVNNMTANGKVCKVELDNTIMKVYLPEVLHAGESITFKMSFATYFDRGGFRRRMALNNSFGAKHFNGVHWYPRISVYDQKKGWDVDQHLNKELYGDYGLFDVELTFSDNYVVEATGALQNYAEVYPADLRERLDIKHFLNKPWNEAPSIITPYDSTKRKTWHFVANNVHDFAFTANPHYRISETNWKGIQCVGLVLEPHASRWANSANYVAKIIQTFSEDFGMYEYPKMIAADANDGMEYPMLTLCGGADPDYRGLFTHEIAHNWFYGMIGNNETYRAALDEGFTQFLTAWGLRKIDGDTMITLPTKNKFIQKNKEANLVLDRNIYNRYMYDAIRGEDKQLNTHSNDFHSALGHENGYSNVYHKTATMLYNLQYVLGDELFQKAMQHYVAKWKIAHPYFEDFRQSIIEFTHQDLNWFFDQWMERTMP